MAPPRAVLLLGLLAPALGFRSALRMMSDAPNPFQALAQRVGSALGQQPATNTNFPKATEAQRSDPGLKVAPMAWKWPPKWPYPPGSFDVRSGVNASSETAPETFSQLLEALPAPSEASAELLKRHFRRFVAPDANKVLLLVDAADDWGPTLDSGLDITLHACDLKTLRGGELPFEPDAFDHVVLPGGAVAYMTEPRQSFREVWRVCRPGGYAYVNFYNSRAGDAQSKALAQEKLQTAKENTVAIWGTLNDAQRMWVVGSLFQFSAGTGSGGGDAGWEDLKGYELSVAMDDTPDEEEEMTDVGMAGVSDDDNSVYLIQAKKQSPPTVDEDPYKAMMYLLALDNSMQEPDRQLVSLRLAAELRRLPTSAGDKAELAQSWADATVKLYESLMQMSAVLGPDLRALLASLVVPHLSAERPHADRVLTNLLEGLGLETPGEFWEPVGEATKTMGPEDRIYLLGTLAPYFGSDATLPALKELPPIMTRALELTMAKLFPEDADMYYEITNPDEPTKGDCQVITADLVLSDWLGVDRGETNAADPATNLLAADEREGFLPWLETVERDTLKEWVNTRRSFKETAIKEHEEKVEAKMRAEGKLPAPEAPALPEDGAAIQDATPKGENPAEGSGSA